MGEARRSVIHVVMFLFAIISTVQAKNPAPAAPAAIPAGVQVTVRMGDKLSSSKAKLGDMFKGSLESPIVVNGQELAPKKAEVMGYVARAHRSSHAGDPGVLELALISVKVGDNYVPLNATLVMSAETHSKHDVSGNGGKLVLASASSGGAGDTVVENKSILTWVSSPAQSQDWNSNKPKDVRSGSGTPFRVLGQKEEPEEVAKNEQPEHAVPASFRFTLADRRALRQCLSANHVVSPASPAAFVRNRPMTATVARRAQVVPAGCSAKLAGLPQGWKMVTVSGRVVALDEAAKVGDWFVIAVPAAQHTPQLKRVSATR